jgi:hypothetical protein
VCGERSEQQENLSDVDFFETASRVRTAGNEEGDQRRGVVEGRAGDRSSDLALRAR